MFLSCFFTGNHLSVYGAVEHRTGNLQTLKCCTQFTVTSSAPLLLTVIPSPKYLASMSCRMRLMIVPSYSSPSDVITLKSKKGRNVLPRLSQHCRGSFEVGKQGVRYPVKQCSGDRWIFSCRHYHEERVLGGPWKSLDYLRACITPETEVIDLGSVFQGRNTRFDTQNRQGSLGNPHGLP